MPLQRCRVFPRYTEVTQGEYKALGTLRYAIKAFVAEIQIAFFIVILVNILADSAYFGDVIVVH